MTSIHTNGTTSNPIRCPDAVGIKIPRPHSCSSIASERLGRTTLVGEEHLKRRSQMTSAPL